jgi:4-amino-4-deoxy-L-arabinose transferase-like glycosyltransferase
VAPTTRRILIIMGIALLLRVLVPVVSYLTVGSDRGFLFPDSGSYRWPAEEILRSGRFANGDRPEINRTPGYSMLLVPGILLGNPVLVTIALQVILSLATVWLVYRISALLFENENAAAGAALLYSLEPLSILYTSLILTETLFTILIVASFYCLADYFKRRQALGTLILAAITLAGSIYVRPVSYYLPFLVSLVLLLALLLYRRKIKYLLHVAVFLIVSFGPLAAWQARNKAETGYNGFSAISAINLYFCQAASIRAKLEGLPYLEVRDRLGSFAEHPEQASWSDPQRYQFMKREGIRMVMRYPGIYARIHLAGMVRILFEPGSLDYLKVFAAAPRSGGTLGSIVDRGLISVVFGLLKNNPLVFWTQLALFGLLIVYYLLAVRGLLRRRCSSVWTKLAVAAVIVYFVAISGGPQGYSRFRHPVMPFLCILAGCGLYFSARAQEKPA